MDERGAEKEARKAAKVAAEVAAAKRTTFDECVEAYLRAHADSWKNAKHRQQWRNTLDSYASPVFGALPVADVDTALVTKCLEPIWKDKTETASRLRGRIESVLDWATVRGFRTSDNPARWKGHLENLLAAPGKVAKVEHHAALAYDQVGEFMALLATLGGTAALAFRFLILTACRTSEVIGATWDEIDLDAASWTIPADRIKAGREHRVPLSTPALEILAEMDRAGRRGFVFPGGKTGKPLSNMAMLALLKRIKRTDLTAHGFRSTFRDWASERTNFPREVCEMSLAHAIGDKVEAAYRRGDLFAKRRQLMDAWARHCLTVRADHAADVVPLRSA